jgi:glycerophosphoryl diester phosphodiesterase
LPLAAEYVIILGHLGNTIDGLQKVVDTGVDGVEFDVRRSADGVLVLHHDAEVEGYGLVSQLSRRELPAWVPTLDDALEICAGLMVNIEVKNLSIDPDRDPNERTAVAVAELVRDRHLYDTVVASSFSMRSLDTIRAVDAGVATARLTLPPGDQLALATTALEAGHQAFHPHADGVNRELVDQLHAVGVKVTPWAVDDLATFTSMADLGVDAVITDDPDAVRPT